MIANSEDLEGHLQRLDRSFAPAGSAGVYLVFMGAGQPPCALSVVPPVLVAQVQVGPAPSQNDAASARFFRQMLELNASGLMHAAFAIEQDRIVLTAALELANLDDNEIEAVLADFEMALTEHVPKLVALSKGPGRK
jgi:hypothetical protein